MRVRFLYVRIWSYVIRRVASLRKRTTKRRLISYRIASFLLRSWLHAMCAAAFLSLSLCALKKSSYVRNYTQAHCSVGRERAGALSLLLRLASALLIKMGSRKRMLLSSLLDSTIPPPSYTCTSMRAKNKMQGGRRAKEARRGVGYSDEEEKDSHLQRCLFAFHTYVYVFLQIWETRKRKQLIAATIRGYIRDFTYPLSFSLFRCY